MIHAARKRPGQQLCASRRHAPSRRPAAPRALYLRGSLPAGQQRPGCSTPHVQRVPHPRTSPRPPRRSRAAVPGDMPSARLLSPFLARK